MAELPNGKFRIPQWAKPILFTALVAIIGWGMRDYMDKTSRLTVLETNYANIETLLQKIDKKVDRLYPDVGPAVRP